MPSILIVDDEPGVRSSLSGVLRDEGFEVEAAASGEECLERAARSTFDVIVLDVWLPGIDGLSVIREAKRLKSDLPVIIITGYSTEMAAIEAVNLGVSGYLTKPFRVPQVLAAAAKAIGEPG